MTDDQTREDLGRNLYHAINRDVFVVDWDDLADHRQERYRIAALLFLSTEAVDTYFTELRRLIAA